MHFSHYYIDKKGINMKRLLATSFTLVLIIGNAGMAIAQPHDDHGPQEEHHDDHAPPPHHWTKGQRIERSDWDRGQHIDYREHHLRAPPRGYEWRQVDGQYVLAAIAGGVIASVILNSQ